MKHALLAALAILYWVVVGHGHTWAFAALALAAIRNDWRRSLECSGLEHEPALSIPGEVPALRGVHEDAFRVMPRQAEPLG